MKAKITLSNIKGFLSAHYRQALDELGFLDEWIKERAAWRLNQVKEKSPECYEKDKCTHCGCQVSSKVFEDRACEGGCYPEMSKVQWESQKQKEMDKDLAKSLIGYHPDIEYTVGCDAAPGIEGQTLKIKLSTAMMIVMDLSKDETLADLMQNNPHLTKEELLYWCPEFKDK